MSRNKLLVSLCAGLAVVLLCASGAQAGDGPPGGASPRAAGQVLVLEDGMSVEVRRQLIGRMTGPAFPGEVRFFGSFVPGLLSASARGELAARVPGSLRGSAGPVPDRRPRRPGLLEDRMIVVLDPGHGGGEHGGTGITGTREKELVLEIAKRIRRTLEELPGVQVIMTRERDENVPLWERVDLADQVQADLFISIHTNAFVRSGFGGVETFFHSLEASDEEARRVARAENAPGRREESGPSDAVMSILADMHRAETLRDSSRFAHLVQKELAAVLPFDNLGVKQADFVVLRGSRMPSVLLELGFLTNRREEKALKQGKIQERIAQAVRMAVIDYRRLLLRKRVLPSAPEVTGP